MQCNSKQESTNALLVEGGIEIEEGYRTQFTGSLGGGRPFQRH